MPFTKKDLHELPISFCGKDEVWVWVGPCSATFWSDYRIPLDGRKYKAGGTVIFSNGSSYRASLIIDTTTFDFVSSDTIYINIGEDWYNLMEAALLEKLCISKRDIFPLKWQTDRPIDYSKKPPFIISE
jgi:hypothetical protein